MPRRIRVVIVDDHPMFRERLVQVIGGEPDMIVVGEADDAAAARRLILEAVPDLLLVDISLPDESGLVLTKSLRDRGLAMPILVISMHAESSYAARAVRAGANGYVTKACAASDILSAVRQVIAVGNASPANAVIDIARRRSAVTRMPAANGGGLTEREMDVLSLLGEGLTSREISSRLSVGISSIDTYRARIKEKMNLRNASELQHFATLWVAGKKSWPKDEST